MYIYIYVSKFGGCKRQDSPAKRTPRTNGKFSRRCARHGVREIPESAIGSCVRACVRCPCVGACGWSECGRECDPNADLSVVKRRCARCLHRKRLFFVKTSLCAVFAAYRVFDPLFVSRWPRFSRRGVVKRRCARLLLKSHSRLRETQNLIKNRHLPRKTAVRDAFKKPRSRLRETRLRMPRLRETPFLKTPLSFETSAFSPRRRRKTSLCAGFASGSS